MGWPVVQKAATGGYDGRGVVILKSPDALSERLPVPGFIEKFVPGMLELSVMVARSANGQSAVWDPVEMEFDPNGNLLTYLIAPARIEPEIAREASKLAIQTIEAFDGVGIFGVESFVFLRAFRTVFRTD